MTAPTMISIPDDGHATPLWNIQTVARRLGVEVRHCPPPGDRATNPVHQVGPPVAL